MIKKFVFAAATVMLSTMTYSQVEIIGHRGASWLAPENTVASARLAWEKGADAVECDIYLSADKKIIVSHDGNTKRTTGQDYNIAQTSSKVLRTLDAGSFKDQEYKGEKLPFLEELIKTVPQGKELVVEIKCGSEVIPFLKKVTGKYDQKVKFVFIGFDFQTITDTKKAFPEKKCYWLCSDKKLLADTFDRVPGAGLEGVSLANALVTEEVMKKAASLRLEVFTWTVDDPVEAKRVIALGVKGITTNRPGWLEEQAGIN